MGVVASCCCAQPTSGVDRDLDLCPTHHTHRPGSTRRLSATQEVAELEDEEIFSHPATPSALVSARQSPGELLSPNLPLTRLSNTESSRRHKRLPIAEVFEQDDDDTPNLERDPDLNPAALLRFSSGHKSFHDVDDDDHETMPPSPDKVSVETLIDEVDETESDVLPGLLSDHVETITPAPSPKGIKNRLEMVLLRGPSMMPTKAMKKGDEYYESESASSSLSRSSSLADPESSGKPPLDPTHRVTRKGTEEKRKAFVKARSGFMMGVDDDDAGKSTAKSIFLQNVKEMKSRRDFQEK